MVSSQSSSFISLPTSTRSPLSLSLSPFLLEKLNLSHLQGMFYRTIRMLESGMKPIYVFDGAPPEAKRDELSRMCSRATRRASGLYSKAMSKRSHRCAHSRMCPSRRSQ